MDPSILKSVKKMLGLAPDYSAFDPDILMFINSVFVTLHQIGVGSALFTVEDDTKTWADLSLTDDEIGMIKSYLFLKVRMLFDPPATSFLIAALERMITEHEWRLVAFYDVTAATTYAPEEVVVE